MSCRPPFSSDVFHRTQRIRFTADSLSSDPHQAALGMLPHGQTPQLNVTNNTVDCHVRTPRLIVRLSQVDCHRGASSSSWRDRPVPYSSSTAQLPEVMSPRRAPSGLPGLGKAGNPRSWPIGDGSRRAGWRKVQTVGCFSAARYELPTAPPPRDKLLDICGKANKQESWPAGKSRKVSWLRKPLCEGAKVQKMSPYLVCISQAGEKSSLKTVWRAGSISSAVRMGRLLHRSGCGAVW